MSLSFKPSLIDQTTSRPMRKVQAAGFIGTPTAAALALIVVALLDLEPTEETLGVLGALFAALGSALAAGIAYFTRNRASEF